MTAAVLAMTSILPRFVVIGLLALCTSLYAGSDYSTHRLPVLTPNAVYTGRYDELVREGNAALRLGDLAKAREAYAAAAREVLVEVPNYTVLIKLAEVECLRSNKEGGRWLVSEFGCMLDVDGGREKCFMDSESKKPNPRLGSLCFKRMCGEMYLAYYESQTSDGLREIEKLRVEAKRVGLLCGPSEE